MSQDDNRIKKRRESSVLGDHWQGSLDKRRYSTRSPAMKIASTIILNSPPYSKNRNPIKMMSGYQSSLLN